MTRVSKNDVYQNAAYGFSTFAFTMLAIIFGLFVVSSAGLTLYDIQAMLRYVRNIERARGSKRWNEFSGKEA
jgi:hypothetical protein